MSALSAADLIRMRQLNEQLDRMPVHDIAATAMADALRLDLPDLDDVTIGRVLLWVAQYAAVSSLHPVTLGMFATGATCAALDLTASEWQEAKL